MPRRKMSPQYFWFVSVSSALILVFSVEVKCQTNSTNETTLATTSATTIAIPAKVTIVNAASAPVINATSPTIIATTKATIVNTTNATTRATTLEPTTQKLTTSTTTAAPTSAAAAVPTEEAVEYVGPIRKCKKGTDEELNKCFVIIIQDLRPKLANGIPEIQLPPLDPLKLERLDFKQGSGSIVIESVFTDILLKGLSNFTKAEFKLNSQGKRLNFVLKAPRIRIDGKYTLGGRIIFIPIGGTGPYWFDVSDVDIKGHCKLKTAQKGNATIAVVDKVVLDLKIKEIKIELLDLFNGNQILGPVINRVLNEESQSLFEEIKPQLSVTIGEIVGSITNAVIANLPFIADYLI